MDARRTHSLSQELSNVEEHMIRNMWWVGNLQTCITKFVKDENLLST